MKELQKIENDAKETIELWFARAESAPKALHLGAPLDYHYEQLTATVNHVDNQMLIDELVEAEAPDLTHISEQQLKNVLNVGVNALEGVMEIFELSYAQISLQQVKEDLLNLTTDMFMFLGNAFDDEDYMQTLKEVSSEVPNARKLFRVYTNEGGSIIRPAFQIYVYVNKWYYNLLGILFEYDFVAEVEQFATMNKAAKAYVKMVVEVLRMLHQEIKEE